MHLIKMTLLLFSFLIITACSGEKQKESITEGGMKCGPGKCGASMVDGSAVLVKKKMNMLKQLREDDDRRACVLNANTTKDLYRCVRVEKTQRLSSKCNVSKTMKEERSSMKCQAGKCGTSM
jgi:hypothetical protein